MAGDGQSHLSLSLLGQGLALMEATVTAHENPLAAPSGAEARARAAAGGADGLREYIQVQLPRGSVAGMTLNVRIPNGEVVSVVVPQGAGPGSYLRTPLDAATPSAAAGGLGQELMARSGSGSGVEEDEVSWVDASLQAESTLRWATWRIRGGLLVGVLATLVGLGAEGEFVTWGEVPLSVSCAAGGEGGEDPSAAWMRHPQSAPVSLSMFQT